jgi:hypothetical protein
MGGLSAVFIFVVGDNNKGEVHESFFALRGSLQILAYSF